MKNSPENELLTEGKKYFSNKDYQRAQECFSKLLEHDDKNADAYYHLANLFHMKGELGKAIKAFNKVLTLDHNHTDAAISLSILYNDIGRYEDGKRVFNLTSERVKTTSSSSGQLEDTHLNKKFAQKHYEMAELYMSYDRYDEALFEYKKTITLAPELLEARVKMAKVYAKKGFVAKSFEELRKLKNEYPSYNPARMALGVLYYGNGNILEAQAEWNKVLSQDPFNADAQMYLNLSKMATETSL